MRLTTRVILPILLAATIGLLIALSGCHESRSASYASAENAMLSMPTRSLASKSNLYSACL